MIKYFAILCAGILVAIDQAIKVWVLKSLAPVGTMEVVPRFFYLTYVENRGAAFGILQSRTLLLIILTSAVLLALLIWVLSGRVKDQLMLWSLSLVIAGGVGNLIDRAFRGFVVDYLDFSALFGFPVFNFADCCVVIGTLLLLCAMIWSDHLLQQQKKEA